MAAGSGAFKVLFTVKGWGGTAIVPAAYADAAFAKFFALGGRVLGRLKQETPVSKYGPNLEAGQDGHLRNKIEQENKIEGGKALIAFHAPSYAKIVISGHGEITPAGAQALRFRGPDGLQFAMHSGPVAPNDFAKRALDASADDIRQTSKDMVWAAVSVFRKRLLG